MKSLILSFVILILFFLVFQPSLMAVINTAVLHYTAIIVFIAVTGCAVIFIGLPKINFKAIKDELLKKEEDYGDDKK